MQYFKGIGNEVILALVAPTFILLFLVIKFLVEQISQAPHNSAGDSPSSRRSWTEWLPAWLYQPDTENPNENVNRNRTHFDTDTCSICIGPFRLPLETNCGHLFCVSGSVYHCRRVNIFQGHAYQLWQVTSLHCVLYGVHYVVNRFQFSMNAFLKKSSILNQMIEIPFVKWSNIITAGFLDSILHFGPTSETFQLLFATCGVKYYVQTGTLLIQFFAFELLFSLQLLSCI
ncbi:uncharacterized protein LOC113216883 isoform X2 [Frankliniella occidentalis]|uniref:Uncharacterized protein LOC113216883 isoform X2 n=1 Tax=Frankliniella occidentalis TaxID=133901 RepID=A0A9C6WW06_FRAOC|nr:uncharacterized protein LOC113216883 isoform X2 [Frankliniella occidentalis]